MKGKAVGRGYTSKGRSWEKLLAHQATTIRQLKIPVFFLTLTSLMRLPQSHPSFPLLPLSFLSLLLLLPHIPLYLHTTMPLLLVPLLTRTQIFLRSLILPLLRKSRKGLRLLTLLTSSLTGQQLYFADFDHLHLTHTSLLTCILASSCLWLRSVSFLRIESKYTISYSNKPSMRGIIFLEDALSISNDHPSAHQARNQRVHVFCIIFHPIPDSRYSMFQRDS